MKVGALVVGLAVVALLGYGWLRQHDRWVRETETARHSRDSLAAVVKVTRDSAAARYRRDSLASVHAIGQRDIALRAARGISDSLSGEVRQLLGSLEAVLPDSLSLYAKRVLAAWVVHLDADLAERRLADSALAARNARIAQQDSSYAADLAAVSAQLDDALRQLKAANARTRPGLVRRALAAAPWIAGAYLVGRLSR